MIGPQRGDDFVMRVKSSCRINALMKETPESILPPPLLPCEDKGRNKSSQGSEPGRILEWAEIYRNMRSEHPCLSGSRGSAATISGHQSNGQHQPGTGCAITDGKED